MKARNVFLLEICQSLHIGRTQHTSTEGRRGWGEGRKRVPGTGKVQAEDMKDHLSGK